MAAKSNSAKSRSAKKSGRSKSGRSKSGRSKSGRSKSGRSKSARKWSQQVQTVSTFPPEGIFTKSAKSIARSLGSKKVSPKGVGSGIRMIQFFINRAGKNLPDERKAELEEAKHILQRRRRREAARGKPSKSSAEKGRKR